MGYPLNRRLVRAVRTAAGHMRPTLRKNLITVCPQSPSPLVCPIHRTNSPSRSMSSDMESLTWTIVELMYVWYCSQYHHYTFLMFARIWRLTHQVEAIIHPMNLSVIEEVSKNYVDTLYRTAKRVRSLPVTYLCPVTVEEAGLLLIPLGVLFSPMIFCTQA